MKKGFIRKLLACGMCVSLTGLPIPIMAEETVKPTTQTTTQANQTGEKALKSTAATSKLAPTSWTELESSFLASAQGQVIDLSSLSASSNKHIVIPDSVTQLELVGDVGKVYQGLVITTTAGRSSALKLTINNLKIQDGYIDIAHAGSGDTLFFKGNNQITATGGNSAVIVKTGHELTLDGSSGGYLKVTGGSTGAGIGGAHQVGTGHIKIVGGDIEAYGKGGSAGIGQCYQPNGSYDTKITITGGNIIADGGYSSTGNGGAGIGGSYMGAVGDITISGSAKVTAKGGTGAAGIGTGSKVGANIVINGGATILSSEGKAGGAGIGSGSASEAKLQNIMIENATIIESKGSAGGAGIGGGSGSSPEEIRIGQNAVIGEKDLISDTYIKGAIGDGGGAGIGGGTKGNQIKLIQIENNQIYRAVGSHGSAGIGGGNECGVEELLINGAEIGYVKGGESGAGIGSGHIGEVGKIKLDGNTIIHEVRGGDLLSGCESGGAAIGGGYERGVSLEITNNVIIEYAKGGTSAGAIGGGAKGSGGDGINITSGRIYAEAGEGTVYNDVGGAAQRETQITVSLGSTSDVFNRNNKIRELDAATKASHAVYIFQCYDKAGTQMTDVQFFARKVGDADYAIRPYTDGGGNGYALMKDFGSSGKNFNSLSYQFWVKIANKTYYAKEDITQPIVETNVDGMKQYTIKLIFDIAANEEPPIAPVIVPGNGIIPYSLSQVAYQVNTSNYHSGSPYEVRDIKTVINLNLQPTDPTSFNVQATPAAKNFTVEVKSDGVKDSVLAAAIKNNLVVNGDKLIITYPDAMKQGRKYEIYLYLPSDLIGDMDVKSYKDSYVNVASKKTVIATTQLKVVEKLNVNGVIVENLFIPPTINQNIEIPYNELIKIK